MIARPVGLLGRALRKACPGRRSGAAVSGDDGGDLHRDRRARRRCRLRRHWSPHRPVHWQANACSARRCRRRHSGVHRRPSSCRPAPPLNRRAAPLRRVPRRRFPDPPFSANQASDPPGRALGLTPDASMMLVARARAERALRHSFGAIGRLPASLSCRIERVSVRYTRFLMGPACPCRSVSSTDTRTDTRGRGPTYGPIHAETREKHRAIHAHCGGDARVAPIFDH